MKIASLRCKKQNRATVLLSNPLHSGARLIVTNPVSTSHLLFIPEGCPSLDKMGTKLNIYSELKPKPKFLFAKDYFGGFFALQYFAYAVSALLSCKQTAGGRVEIRQAGYGPPEAGSTNSSSTDF